MEKARIQFTPSISFTSQVSIVRTLQTVMTDLHLKGLNYQVRMAGDKNGGESDPVPATVLLLGPANPPTFLYPSGELPELEEPYHSMATTFITSVIRTGIIDLISLRDIIADVAQRDASE